MKYTCKHCGWVKQADSSYLTSDDYSDIFKHEKTHG